MTKKRRIDSEYTTWDDMAGVIDPIEWAWRKWLPYGMLCIVAGSPATGKSTLALYIARVFIEGCRWPDGTPYKGGTGSVVWAEAEAAQAINLQRARDWGLPLDRLLTPLSDPLEDINLGDPEHLKSLTQKALLDDVRLVVVDSLRGSHRLDENSSLTIEVVHRLAKLAQLSEKPVLLLHHLRKQGKLDGSEITIDRLRGSSAIVQPARVIWAIDTPDLRNPAVHRLKPIKNNLAPLAQAIGFTISATGIHFCEAPQRPTRKTKGEEAVEFLLAALADGERAASSVTDEADSEGIARKTLMRARKQLGIKPEKRSDGWYWELPKAEQGCL